MVNTVKEVAARQIGQKAPDFILKDQYGEDFKLSAFRGKRVLLSFLPLAWTPESAAQVKALDASVGRFDGLNTVVVGISVDSVPTKKAWTAYLGTTKLRLLADFWPHGLVSDEYEVLRQMVGYAERANIIVDENGIITFVRKYAPGEVPDIEEIVRALNLR